MYQLPVGLGADTPNDLLAQLAPQIASLVQVEAARVGVATKAETTKQVYIVGAVAAVAGGILGVIGSRLINKRR